MQCKDCSLFKDNLCRYLGIVRKEIDEACNEPYIRKIAAKYIKNSKGITETDQGIQ